MIVPFGIWTSRKRMGATTKSGLIIGMGESVKEIHETLKELRRVNCDIVTIGQYLQPTRHHIRVVRYYPPDFFKDLKEEAFSLRVFPCRIWTSGTKFLSCGATGTP